MDELFSKTRTYHEIDTFILENLHDQDLRTQYKMYIAHIEKYNKHTKKTNYTINTYYPIHIIDYKTGEIRNQKYYNDIELQAHVPQKAQYLGAFKYNLYERIIKANYTEYENFYNHEKLNRDASHYISQLQKLGIPFIVKN